MKQGPKEMQVSFYEGENGEPLTWSNRGKRASIFGIIRITALFPLPIWCMFPHWGTFKFFTLWLCIDTYLKIKHAIRVRDIIRKVRVFINGGFWTMKSSHQVRTGYKWNEYTEGFSIER